jgi:hypothetical protein
MGSGTSSKTGSGPDEGPSRVHGYPGAAQGVRRLLVVPTRRGRSARTIRSSLTGHSLRALRPFAQNSPAIRGGQRRSGRSNPRMPRWQRPGDSSSMMRWGTS